LKRNLIETFIGFVVILVAAVFLVFAYTSTNVRAVSGYAIQAKFANATGINPGADVKISGVKVGTVTEQSLDPQTFQAIVRMQIKDGIKLPIDSTAVVATEGLLGGTFLQIQPGGDAEMLKPGETVEYTQSAIGLQDIIGRFIFNSDSGSKPAAGGGEPAKTDGASDKSGGASPGVK
jgi:phospholipid/cholesterol/gamma-HCH transport system substrate-binding protein